MPKLVIAEDNPFVVAMVRDALADSGHEVCGVASSKQELLSMGERHRPDLAIVDVRLSDGGSGVDAAVELAIRVPVSILFATGLPEQVLDPPAPVGAACLSKPFTAAELIQAVEITLRIAACGELPNGLPPKLRLIRRDRDRSAV